MLAQTSLSSSNRTSLIALHSIRELWSHLVMYAELLKLSETFCQKILWFSTTFQYLNWGTEIFVGNSCSFPASSYPFLFLIFSYPLFYLVLSALFIVRRPSPLLVHFSVNVLSVHFRSVSQTARSLLQIPAFLWVSCYLAARSCVLSLSHLNILTEILLRLRFTLICSNVERRKDRKGERIYVILDFNLI